MFTPPDFHHIQESILNATSKDVARAINKERLTIDDLIALLSPAAEPFLPQMAERAREITAQRFGNTTQIYAPLYLSNLCKNQCAYCGFSASNKITRRILNIDEVENEAKILAKRGLQHILLVTGEAPHKAGVDYLEKVALRLRTRFASLSIEVQPLEVSEYKRLFNAGITAVTVYQETYDPVIYKKVHLAGKKTDYKNRLEIPARAAASGMREVGIGVLLGLSDWRAEGVTLGLHLVWLRKHFWKTSFTVSFPRLRPAAGEFSPLVRVDEKNLCQLIFSLRLFDHDVGLVLSTREEARYRDGMLGLGPTRYSAGSSTSPGGYSSNNNEGEQFSIGDHRSVDQVCLSIMDKGIDPVCKDWDKEFQL